jgi:spore coat polysaccharide biosynthesis protein SpsF (cytidylyltransferase family)
MEKLKIGIIIQARTSSSRLPSKIFKRIGKIPMLKFLIERLEKVQHIDQIIVATSKNKSDDLLVEHLKENNNINIFRGSLENVLDRFYECAKANSLDVIVRVTADDPFKDPDVINKGLGIFLRNNYDYVSNTILPTYPEGIDIEIFSFKALLDAYNNAKDNSDMLHVTPYIWKNEAKFNLYNFTNEEDNSNVRLTCDYEEDFIYLNEIYSHIKSLNFSFNDVLDIIHTHNIKHKKPVIRNEGYIEDLNNENK